MSGRSPSRWRATTILRRGAVRGAATGVGGIIRDILAMGARPVALLDSLRSDRSTRAEPLPLQGVVRGIGGYGNAVGVPTVGGEVEFARALLRQPAGQCDVRGPDPSETS